MISTALGETNNRMLHESFLILTLAGMNRPRTTGKAQLAKKSTRAPQRFSSGLVAMTSLVLQNRPLRFKHIGLPTRKLALGPVDVPRQMLAVVVVAMAVGCRLGDLMVLERPMTVGGVLK
jgi:hypothetical protein